MEPGIDIDRASPARLAKVLAFGAGPGEGVWRPQELEAILRFRLAAPLPDDWSRDEASSGARPRTFGELLLHPNPPPALLRHLTAFAEGTLCERAEGSQGGSGPFPPEVAALLYYATAAAHLVAHGGDHAASLARGLAWAVRLPWIDLGLRLLFERALDGFRAKGMALEVPPPDEVPYPSLTRLPPPSSPNAVVDSSDLMPHVPGYQIVAPLGEGGGGTVWRAVQLGTRRAVALKLLAAAPGSRRARARFEREVELASRLEHPHVARVYDSGVHRGHYYCAMELVAGAHLDQYAAGQRLDRRRTLALVRDVCLAVEYAHRRGVIHRDLKPSNILVAPDGQPRVVDFGLAVACEPDGAPAADAARLTRDGHCAGTPAFMSPEQAAGDPRRIDTRTDVYALGATLRLLLAGRPPNEAATNGADLDAGLKAILLKALAPDPEQRYGTAGELARDIDAYLRGDPLIARPPTRAAAAARWVKRHRLRLAAAAAVLAAFAAMAAYAYWRVDRARAVAVAARQDAEVQAAAARASAAEAERQHALAQEQWRQGQVLLGDARLSAGDALASGGRWHDAAARYESAHDAYAAAGARTRRADAALMDAYRFARPPLLRLDGGHQGHDGPVRCVALSPDGRLVATGGEDRTIRLWELPTGRLVRTLAGHAGPLRGVAFSPDGARVLSGEAGPEHGLRLWDVATGACLLAARAATGQHVLHVAVSPDGRCGAWVATDHLFGLVDLTSGQPVEAQPAGTETGGGSCVAFAPDGRRLAAGARYGNVLLHERGGRADDRPLAPVQGVVNHLAFSPGGDSLLVGGNDGRAVVYVAADGAIRREFGRHGDAVVRVGFSGDGRRAFTACRDGVLRTWDLATGEQLGAIWTDGDEGDVAWSPDGAWAVAVGADGVPKVWDVRPEAEGGGGCPAALLRRPPAPVVAAALSRDGRLAALATGPAGMTADVYDLATGRLLRSLPTPRGTTALAFSPDGARLAAGADETGLRVFDLAAASDEPAYVLPGHDEPVRAACFAPTGGGNLLLSVSGTDGRLWDLDRGGALRWTARAGSVLVRAAGFTADGRFALGAGTHGFAARVDAASGAVAALTPEASQWGRVPANAAFLHDGRSVFCAADGPDGLRLGVWDLATGHLLCRMQGADQGRTTCVTAADDDNDGGGPWGASGDRSGNVSLWDLTDGRELRRLGGVHHGEVCDAVAGGRGGGGAGLLLTAGAGDGTVRVWDLRRPARYRAFARRLADDLPRLRADPRDAAAALATLGEWYAERGVWRWAADLLSDARARGAAVSPLTLARCHWMAGRYAEARHELEWSQRAGDEAPPAYLTLCLRAVAHDTRAAPTSPPADLKLPPPPAILPSPAQSPE